MLPKNRRLVPSISSPQGTLVTLHNGSGSSADDIVGNWPETLDVDGPGQLADYLGEPIAGDWTLHVVDDAGSDTGTLVAWGLNILVPAVITAAPGDVPAVTRLVGNAPNPFNPQTTIAFDLARAQSVRLEVFDLRGRLVRRLQDGVLAAGRHEVRWDGRDDEKQSADHRFDDPAWQREPFRTFYRFFLSLDHWWQKSGRQSG